MLQNTLLRQPIAVLNVLNVFGLQTRRSTGLAVVICMCVRVWVTHCASIVEYSTENAAFWRGHTRTHTHTLSEREIAAENGDTACESPITSYTYTGSGSAPCRAWCALHYGGDGIKRMCVFDIRRNVQARRRRCVSTVAAATRPASDR